MAIPGVSSQGSPLNVSFLTLQSSPSQPHSSFKDTSRFPSLEHGNCCRRLRFECQSISSSSSFLLSTDSKCSCFLSYSDSSARSIHNIIFKPNVLFHNARCGLNEMRSKTCLAGETSRSVLRCSLHNYDGNWLETGHNLSHDWALRSLTSSCINTLAFGLFRCRSHSLEGHRNCFAMYSTLKIDYGVLNDMPDSRQKISHQFACRQSNTIGGHSEALGLFRVGSMPLTRKRSHSVFCSSLETNDDVGKVNRSLETRQNSCNISRPPKIMPPCRAKKWKDPFDYGGDPDFERGQLFTEGKQSPEEPLPSMDPNNPEGPLKFPAFHNLEFAPLALKVRGDVRRCCCLVAGGVYENLLFFPVIQLLKDRYPGVRIDIMTGERGKQTYEINKNVRRAWVFDFEPMFLKASDYAEGCSKLKEEYYDLIISTKLAGWGHAAFLLLTDATRRLGYVYPNVYSAGAATLLSEAFKAPSMNLAEGGYNMYAELLEELAKPDKGVPKSMIPPLRVSIGKPVKAVVQEKCKQVGVAKGDFVVFHGIESDSAASMQSKGDHDSLLPLNVWAILAKSTSAKAVFVIPHEKERPKVSEAVGEDAAAIFITTPGQLAAIVNDSLGVVTTNTAALQLAIALDKPSVALFASAQKARLFVPNGAGRCAVVSSRTGNLKDIDVKAASIAVSTIAKEALVFA